MNDTTRRYARTMQEAFPHDAQYAVAIEGYTGNHRMTVFETAIVILSLAVCVCVALYFLL